MYIYIKAHIQKIQEKHLQNIYPQKHIENLIKYKLLAVKECLV